MEAIERKKCVPKKNYIYVDFKQNLDALKFYQFFFDFLKTFVYVF